MPAAPHLPQSGHQAPLALEVDWVLLPRALLPVQQAAQHGLSCGIQLRGYDLRGRQKCNSSQKCNTAAGNATDAGW